MQKLHKITKKLQKKLHKNLNIFYFVSIDNKNLFISKLIWKKKFLSGLKILHTLVKWNHGQVGYFLPDLELPNQIRTENVRLTRTLTKWDYYFGSPSTENFTYSGTLNECFQQTCKAGTLLFVCSVCYLPFFLALYSVLSSYCLWEIFLFFFSKDSLRGTQNILLREDYDILMYKLTFASKFGR